MNKIILKNKYKSKIFLILTKHIQNNKRKYIIVYIIFFISFIIGIMYINNLSSETISNLSDHIKNIACSLKESQEIDYLALFKKSIVINIILVIIIWISSSTIIGIPIVFTEIAFKGFSLSYTISSILI